MEMEAGPLKSPPESPFSKISPSQPSPVTMKFAPTLLLAAAATAAVLPLTTPSIAVHLAHVDNTQVRVTITNTGAHALRLLQRGTILDPHPVRKVDVHTADGTTPPPSSSHPSRAPLTESSRDQAPVPRHPPARAPRRPRPRRLRPPGASLAVLVDVARAHDLGAPRRALRLSASGSLPFASRLRPGDAAVAGRVHYRSNALALRVDGARAAAARALFGRSLVADCAGAAAGLAPRAPRMAARASPPRRPRPRSARGRGQVRPPPPPPVSPRPWDRGER